MTAQHNRASLFAYTQHTSHRIVHPSVITHGGRAAQNNKRGERTPSCTLAQGAHSGSRTAAKQGHCTRRRVSNPHRAGHPCTAALSITPKPHNRHTMLLLRVRSLPRESAVSLAGRDSRARNARACAPPRSSRVCRLRVRAMDVDGADGDGGTPAAVLEADIPAAYTCAGASRAASRRGASRAALSARHRRRRAHW